MFLVKTIKLALKIHRPLVLTQIEPRESKCYRDVKPIVGSLLGARLGRKH
jgi:hypothetical protein